MAPTPDPQPDNDTAAAAPQTADAVVPLLRNADITSPATSPYTNQAATPRMNSPSSSNPVDPKVAQALRRQRSKEALQKARLRKEDELRALQAQVSQLRREKRSLQASLDKEVACSQSVMERVTLLVARHKALAAANMTLQSHLARAQELFPELRQHLPPVPPVGEPSYAPDYSLGAPSPRHPRHPHLDQDDPHAPAPMAVDASEATECYSTIPAPLTTQAPGLAIFSAAGPRHAIPRPGAPRPAHPAHSNASHDDYHHPPASHASHHAHPRHPESPSPTQDPSTTAPATGGPTRSTGSAPPPPRAPLCRPRGAIAPSPFNPMGHHVSRGRPTCSDSQDSAGATTTLQRHWSGSAAPHPPDLPPTHPLCSLEAVASTSSYLTRPTPSPVQLAPLPNDAPRCLAGPPSTLFLPSRISHSTRHHDPTPSALCSAPAAPSSRPRSPPRASPRHHHHLPTFSRISDAPPYDSPAPSAYSNGHRPHTHPDTPRDPLTPHGPVSQTSTEPSSYYHDDVTRDTHGTQDDHPLLNDTPSFNLSSILTLSSIPISMSPAAPELFRPPSVAAGPLADPTLPPPHPADPYHHPHHARHPQTIFRSNPIHALPSVNSLSEIPTLDSSDPYAMASVSVPSLQIFAGVPPNVATPSPWPDTYPDEELNGNGHHPHHVEPPCYSEHNEPPYHHGTEASPRTNDYSPHELYPPPRDEPYSPRQAGSQQQHAQGRLHSSSRQASRLNNQRTRLQQLVWTTDH